jgi:hypothetical protein
LDSVVKNRDSIISELKQRIKLLQQENKNYTETIIKLNNYIFTTSKKVDSVSEHQIKLERKFWQGLHLHISNSTNLQSFVPEFKTDLTYELNRWSLGIEATTLKNYYINIKYTIF